MNDILQEVMELLRQSDNPIHKHSFSTGIVIGMMVEGVEWIDAVDKFMAVLPDDLKALDLLPANWITASALSQALEEFDFKTALPDTSPTLSNDRQ